VISKSSNTFEPQALINYYVNEKQGIHGLIESEDGRVTSAEALIGEQVVWEKISEELEAVRAFSSSLGGIAHTDSSTSAKSPQKYRTFEKPRNLKS
jgi:hypothetical protein